MDEQQQIKELKKEIKVWKELYKDWEGEMTILRTAQKQYEANVRYLKREHEETVQTMSRIGKNIVKSGATRERKLKLEIKSLKEEHTKEVEQLKLINDDIHYINGLQDEKQVELQDRVNGLEEEIKKLKKEKEETENQLEWAVELMDEDMEHKWSRIINLRYSLKGEELKKGIDKILKGFSEDSDEEVPLGMFDMSSDDSDEDEENFWEWFKTKYEEDEDITTEEMHPLYKPYKLWCEQHEEQEKLNEEVKGDRSVEEFVSSVCKSGYWGFELTASHPLLPLYTDYFQKERWCCKGELF